MIIHMLFYGGGTFSLATRFTRATPKFPCIPYTSFPKNTANKKYGPQTFFSRRMYGRCIRWLVDTWPPYPKGKKVILPLVRKITAQIFFGVGCVKRHYPRHNVAIPMNSLATCFTSQFNGASLCVCDVYYGVCGS